MSPQIIGVWEYRFVAPDDVLPTDEILVTNVDAVAEYKEAALAELVRRNDDPARILRYRDTLRNAERTVLVKRDVR